MKNKKIIFLFVLIVVGWFVGSWASGKYSQHKKLKSFITDFSDISISLDDLIQGNVGKDDIPDVLQPKFTSVKDAKLSDSDKGVLVDITGSKRFYPINILIWHEVINDFMAGVPYAVTYSPFCESVAVFRSSTEDQGLKFRATGFLYKSNLVFYDTKTESFWSQGLGQSIAGKFNGNYLDLVKTTQVLTFKDIRKNHFDAEVLSEDTGYFKNYSFNPYSGYLDTPEIPDFSTYENKRFPAKEMMYVVPLGEKSLVFPIADLPEEEIRYRSYEGNVIRAGKVGSEIVVTKDGERMGGYSQMWFCWADLHKDNGVVWDIKLEEMNKANSEKDL